MDLSFAFINDMWVAEFEATGIFNLHIERAESGDMYISQKTVADGEYAPIDKQGYLATKKVFDSDFPGVVFPKYIKVTSRTQPSKAVVTFAQ